MPGECSDFLVLGGGVIGLDAARALKPRFIGCSVVVRETEGACRRHACTGRVRHAGFYCSADTLTAPCTSCHVPSAVSPALACNLPFSRVVADESRRGGADTITRAGSETMRIVITGNMGYIGPSVVERLRASYPDAELIGLDTGYFAHCLTCADGLPERRLDLQHFGDVRRPPAGLLEGAYAVVHLAAISNDPMGHTYERVTGEINHQASVRLARAAKAAGVRRFIFASSCSMYGYAAEGERREQDPLNPLTAYARSKVAVERELEALADPAFVVTALRFATACGMSRRLRLDLVLNDFVAGAVLHREIGILSDGTPWRPLIHVDDMARAIDWAIERGADTGEYLAVNAGSDEWNYQVRGLAEAVARILPGVRVSMNPAAAPDKRSYRVSFALYRRLAPRHQPQIGLDEAIRGLKAGIEAIDFRSADFRSSPYIRLRVLGDLRAQGLLDESLRWTIPSALPRAAEA